MFKKLKNDRKTNIVADAVCKYYVFGYKYKRVTFQQSKARAELRDTHLNANFLLKEKYKSGTDMHFRCRTITPC
jgi:hypothetical protein